MNSGEVPQEKLSLAERSAAFKKNGDKLKEEKKEYEDIIRNLELEKTEAVTRILELQTKRDSAKLQKYFLQTQINHLNATIKQDSKETEATELKIVELRRQQIKAGAVLRLETASYQHELKVAKLNFTQGESQVPSRKRNSK